MHNIKSYFLLLLLCCCSSLFGQNNNGSNKEDSILYFKKLVTDNNRVYFYSFFSKNYKENPNYYNTTTLADTNDTFKYNNYNILLRNISIDETLLSDDRNIAKDAIEFNDNYIQLYTLKDSLYNSLFSNAIDSATSLHFFTKLNNLSLSKYAGLNTDKEKMISSIIDYVKKTCELQSKLEKYQKLVVGDKAAMQSVINKEKKIYNYPYFIQLLTKIGTYPNSVNRNMLPCYSSLIEHLLTNNLQ